MALASGLSVAVCKNCGKVFPVQLPLICPDCGSYQVTITGTSTTNIEEMMANQKKNPFYPKDWRK